MSIDFGDANLAFALLVAQGPDNRLGKVQLSLPDVTAQGGRHVRPPLHFLGGFRPRVGQVAMVVGGIRRLQRFEGGVTGPPLSGPVPDVPEHPAEGMLNKY